MPSLDPDDAIATVFALPVSRRIELVQELWDSIAHDNAAEAPPIELSPQQVAELDRRLAEMRADPSKSLSEEEFWRRVRGLDEQ